MFHASAPVCTTVHRRAPPVDTTPRGLRGWPAGGALRCAPLLEPRTPLSLGLDMHSRPPESCAAWGREGVRRSPWQALTTASDSQGVLQGVVRFSLLLLEVTQLFELFEFFCLHTADFLVEAVLPLLFLANGLQETCDEFLLL